VTPGSPHAHEVTPGHVREVTLFGQCTGSYGEPSCPVLMRTGHEQGVGGPGNKDQGALTFVWAPLFGHPCVGTDQPGVAKQGPVHIVRAQEFSWRGGPGVPCLRALNSPCGQDFWQSKLLELLK